MGTRAQRVRAASLETAGAGRRSAVAYHGWESCAAASHSNLKERRAAAGAQHSSATHRDGHI